MKVRIIIIFVMLFTVTACTIQKRQHLKGWNIEWNKQYKNTTENGQEPSVVKANETALIKDKDSQKNVDQNAIEEEEVKVFPIQNEVNEIVESESSPAILNVLEKNQVANTVNQSPTEQATQSVLKKRTKKDESGNGILLLTTTIMALSILAGLRLGKKRFKKLTKWAKANPKKTQLIIAGIQLPIMAMSLYGGYNLHKLGYSISEAPMYAAAGIMALGMSTVPFVMKRNKFILQARLNRRKMAFLGVSLASMMLMVGFGNNVEKNQPNSIVSHVFQKVDQSIFSQNMADSQNINFSKAESSQVEKDAQKKISNKRKALGAGLAFLAVLGFILLIVTFCAGICMIIFAIGGGSSAIFLGLGGLALAILSIMGMAGIINLFKNAKTAETIG